MRQHRRMRRWRKRCHVLKRFKNKMWQAERKPNGKQLQLITASSRRNYRYKRKETELKLRHNAAQRHMDAQTKPYWTYRSKVFKCCGRVNRRPRLMSGRTTKRSTMSDWTRNSWSLPWNSGEESKDDKRTFMIQ